jgi:hypothetical protein
MTTNIDTEHDLFNLNSEINTNQKDELTHFKEELLQSIREVEERISSNLSLFKDEFQRKLIQVDSKFTEFTVKVDELNNASNLDKIKLEKVSDLIIFQKKTSDQLISHDMKLNNMQKDLTNACYKYDKIYLDNLVLPGIIGEFCRFKNLKEYIDDNLKQVQNLTSFKEKHSTELKNYRDKLDTMLKQMTMQLESNEKVLKSYTNLMVQETEGNLRREYGELTNRLGEIKLENSKYAVELNRSAKELNVEYEKLVNIRNDLGKHFDDNVNNMRESHKTTVDSFDTLRGQFDRIKTRFNEVSEFIKDVRFRRNLNDEKVSKQELKQMSNRLTFEQQGQGNPSGQVISSPTRKKGSEEMYIDEQTLQLKERELIPFVDDNTGHEEIYVNKQIIQNRQRIEDGAENMEEENIQSRDGDSLIRKYINGEINAYGLQVRKNERSQSKKTKANIPLQLSNTQLNKEILSNPAQLASLKDHSRDNSNQFGGPCVNNSEAGISNEVCSARTTTSKKFKDRFPVNNKEKKENSILSEKSEKDSVTNCDLVISSKNPALFNTGITLTLPVNAPKDMKEFVSTFNDFKKDFNKKMISNDKKALEIEHYTKKKLEELASQIRHFIPISFNAYVRSKNYETSSNSKLPHVNVENIIINDNYATNNYSVNIMDPKIIKPADNNYNQFATAGPLTQKEIKILKGPNPMQVTSYNSFYNCTNGLSRDQAKDRKDKRDRTNQIKSNFIALNTMLTNTFHK